MDNKKDMTKEEIIKLYLSDLKNILPDSPAKRSRIIDLEEELEQTESENERLKAEREWISVNDRFPEKNGKYLCYLVHDDPKLDSRMAVIFRNNSWSTVIGDNWIKTHSITHWMPLPEPPKQ